MKVNREETERSIYPKTHTSDENIVKAWNPVCVDRANKIKHAYYIETLIKFHRSVQRKNLNLGPPNGSSTTTLQSTKHLLSRRLETGTPPPFLTRLRSQ
jgi:hypothetical protein